MEYVAPINGDQSNSNRSYVDGDPSIAQAGSIPSARFFNLLMNEARSLVEGAGLTLDANDDAQWLAAVQAIADNGDLDAHEAAADPHPQYLTNSEGQALIDAHAGAADPHTQYLQASDLYQFGLGDNPVSSEDADTVTTAGWRTVGSTTSNIPSAESGFLCTTHSDGTNAQAQIFIEGDAGAMWFRARRSVATSSEWFQWRKAATDNEMIGQVSHFAASVAPSGWLKANGALISRTSYSELWGFAQASGNLSFDDASWQVGQFSPGDGTTTFRIPDLRGEFLRGFDDMRGVDAGRGFGSRQEDEFKSHAHVLLHGDYVGSNIGSINLGGIGNTNIQFTNATKPEGGAETRPRNVALLACIKY